MGHHLSLAERFLIHVTAEPQAQCRINAPTNQAGRFFCGDSAPLN
jgi:hypothetical protein